MAREFARAFYKSDEWQKMREYILIRDKYRCQKCGKSGALEVHHVIHLTPDNINNTAITLNDRNLITLCRDCHFKEHEQEKIEGAKRAASNEKRPDCGEGFRFDENGFLVPVEVLSGKS